MTVSNGRNIHNVQGADNTPTPEEIGAKLRHDAFETRLEVEPAQTSNGLPRSFGLIHEFWQQGVVVTMAAFKTGDLSLYFSNGGGILGGIQQDKVAEMVRKTIPLLGGLTPQLERSDEMEPPAPGEVTFTVLTTEGRYRSRVSAMPERNLENANFQLFALSQGLISELRKASEGGAT
jgi:hypothetical protein